MKKWFTLLLLSFLVTTQALADSVGTNFQSDFSLGLNVGSTLTPNERLHIVKTSSGASVDEFAIANADTAANTAACYIMLDTGTLSGWTNGLTRVCATRTSTGSMNFSIVSSPGGGGAPATVFQINGADGGILPTVAQTTVNCSTSGTAKFSEPFQGSTHKEVTVYMAACLGTASFTFTTAFTNTPAILTTNGPASSVVTSLSTSAMTVTGASTTGYEFLKGY